MTDPWLYRGAWPPDAEFELGPRLEAERAIEDAARAALRRGDYARALVLLDPATLVMIATATGDQLAQLRAEAAAYAAPRGVRERVRAALHWAGRPRQ